MASSSYRPRRTRIYDTSYNIGEKYYKKQLDDLENRKTFNNSRGESLSRDFKPVARVQFLENDREDDPFDFPNLNLRSKSVLRSIDADDIDLGLTTIKRPWEESEKLKSKSESSSKYTSLLNTPIEENILRKSPVVGEVLGDQVVRRSTFLSERQFTSSNRGEQEATSRVKSTEARLANLESEMSGITERQSARELRSRNLKKFLIESENSTLN